MVNQVQDGEAAVITRHGKPQAVIMSFQDWQKLSTVPSFGRLLMSAPIPSGDRIERNRKPFRDVSL